jgi:3-(3-hydroxy-phenyl)propionate hydroxylase
VDTVTVTVLVGGWWLPRRALSQGETLTLDAATAEGLAALRRGAIPVEPIVIAREGGAPGGIETLHDVKGRVRERYDLQPGTVYLVRPDQHVAARWRRFDPAAIEAALRRASGQRA